MLPLPSLRKLMRESFRAPAPGAPVAPEARMAWLEALQGRLTGWERVKVQFGEDHTKDQPPRRAERLSISVQPPRAGPQSWYRGESFLVRFDDAGRPTIVPDGWYRRGDLSATIGDAGEVRSFLEAVMARQERTSLRDKKKEKVAGLRKHTFAAQLRELADRHQFAFALEHSHRNLRLAIRVERKTGYIFSFPTSRFDDVYGMLPGMLAELRRLLALGVSIKTGMNLLRYGQTEWIEPAPLPPGEDLHGG